MAVVTEQYTDGNGIVREITRQDDQKAVVKVWWPVGEDAGMASDARGNVYDDGNAMERVQFVCDEITAFVEREFPNATDVQIVQTDSFSPRFEDEDGNDFEHGYDMLTQAESDAEVGASEKWPIDERATCGFCGERIDDREHIEGEVQYHENCPYGPEDPDVDDDPCCTNCGIHRSEHGMAQCDGFTTQPGGFVVYTSSDLAEMSPEDIDDLLGRDVEARWRAEDEANLWGPAPTPVATADLGPHANEIWIAGLGWIRKDSVKCAKCGDQGRIVTGWEDQGDSESGPMGPVPTTFDYCDCLEGWKAKAEDLQEQLYFHMADRLIRTTELEVDRELQGAGVAHHGDITTVRLYAEGNAVQPLLAVGEFDNIMTNARERLQIDPDWRLRIEIVTNVRVISPAAYEREQAES